MKDEHQESKDEDSLFGLSIAVSLRRLDPQKKSLAKIRMQKVLYEIEFSPPFPQQPSFPPFPANFPSSE